MRTKSARRVGLLHSLRTALITERVRSLVRGFWRRIWTWEIEADILVGKLFCGDGCEAIWARAACG